MMKVYWFCTSGSRRTDVVMGIEYGSKDSGAR